MADLMLPDEWRHLPPEELNKRLQAERLKMIGLGLLEPDKGPKNDGEIALDARRQVEANLKNCK